MSANSAPSLLFMKTVRLINALGRPTIGVQTVGGVRTVVRGEGRGIDGGVSAAVGAGHRLLFELQFLELSGTVQRGQWYSRIPMAG